MWNRNSLFDDLHESGGQLNPNVARPSAGEDWDSEWIISPHQEIISLHQENMNQGTWDGTLEASMFNDGMNNHPDQGGSRSTLEALRALGIAQSLEQTNPQSDTIITNRACQHGYKPDFELNVNHKPALLMSDANQLPVTLPAMGKEQAPLQQPTAGHSLVTSDSAWRLLQPQPRNHWTPNSAMISLAGFPFPTSTTNEAATPVAAMTSMSSFSVGVQGNSVNMDQNTKQFSLPHSMHDSLSPIDLSFLSAAWQPTTQDSTIGKLDSAVALPPSCQKQRCEVIRSHNENNAIFRSQLPSSESIQRSTRKDNHKVVARKKDLKKKGTKKPKGKPTKNRSSYNFFFRYERQRLLGLQNTTGKSGSSSGGKQRMAPHYVISFENLGKLVASRWKEIGEDERAVYGAMAREDKIRYDKELKAYHEKVAQTKNETGMWTDSTQFDSLLDDSGSI